MADHTPPRIVRTVPPGAPGRMRPPPILIPQVDPRILNFNANRAPRQMNPGGSPGRRKGGRRTRRRKIRKTRGKSRKN